MRLNLIGKIIWTIIAYSPLFIAIILKYCLKSHFSLCQIFCTISISIIIFLAITLILKYGILDYAEDTTPQKEYCNIIESNNTEYVLFVVTYLIPFYNINFKPENLIPAIFLFSIILIFYIKTPLFAVNPVLKLLKYNLYTATRIKTNKNIILISKNRYGNTQMELGLIDLSEDIYITTKYENGEVNE